MEATLDGLMRRYRSRVPEVAGIIQSMVAEKVINDESEVENDHIAFRSLGVPYLGIGSLS